MTQLIPFDDRDGVIWYDGELLPWREATLHVLSHGLHYGGSVFEGIRVYNKRPFKLREHSERLIRSGQALDFTIPWSLAEIEDASMKIIEENGISDGYLRPVAWRGTEQLAIAGKQCKIHLAFACWKWPKYFFPKGGEGKGLMLQTSKWVRPDPRSMPVQSKCAGTYTIGTLAKHAADDAGYDDALLLDYKGRVAESSGSNIFLMKDGTIHTPDPECFLNGITRQTVIGLAKDMGYDVEVRTIMPDELSTFEECFVTGTAAEITAVGQIDNIDYKLGPITKELQKAYADLVRSAPA